jgi:predicted DCC family thiol-disulfide oxidoreductase YuxK
VSKVKVYYNSACPVCNAGISAEKRRMDACPVEAEWIDIHAEPNAVSEIGADQEFVRERLHVVDEAGVVHVGADAFRSLWSKTPSLRYVAAVMKLPLVGALTRVLYNAFAALLYRWNKAKRRW